MFSNNKTIPKLFGVIRIFSNKKGFDSMLIEPKPFCPGPLFFPVDNICYLSVIIGIINR
jgi:hypothetical protein